MTDKNYKNGEQDRRIEKMEGHIETTNREMGEVKTDLAKVKTDVAWLKRFFWIVATSSIGALLAGVFNLLK